MIFITIERLTGRQIISIIYKLRINFNWIQRTFVGAKCSPRLFIPRLRYFYFVSPILNETFLNTQILHVVMSNLKSSSGYTSSGSPWSCNTLLCIHEEHSWVPQLSSLNSLNTFLKSFFYVLGFLMIHRCRFYQMGLWHLLQAAAYTETLPSQIIFISIERLE